MNNTESIRALAIACALLAAGCSSCGREGGRGSTAGGGPASAAPSGPGVPTPPFQGELPKGAMKVESILPGRYGGALVLAVAGNPKSFNPILQNETSTSDIISGPVFAGCWGYDNAAQADRPELCEKYERSADNLIYTFTLREGLRWSDGQPITVDDLAFSYNVVTDPKIASSVKDLFKQKDPATGGEGFPVLEKVDDRIFRFKLKEPNVVFQNTVGSLKPIPRHKYEAAYERGEFHQTLTLQTPPDDIVGSGPFRIKTFATEERVVLERNPYYWKVDSAGHRLPYLDRVVFVIVPDFNVSLLKFREGETHLYELRPEDVELLRRDQDRGDYRVHELGPSFNTTYFMLNLDDRSDKDGAPYVDPVKMAWFKDKGFRQALSYGIDRSSIVNVVFQGRGQPHYGFTSPANKAWYNPGIQQYPYNLEKARQLLAASGFVLKEAALYDKAGNRVSFTTETNANNSNRIAILNLLKEDFGKLGIEVKVQPVPFNDLVTRVMDSRKFEAIVFGWSSGVPPDPSQFLNVLLSSGRSHGWYPNQKEPLTAWERRMDELTRQVGQVADAAQRKQIYGEIEAIWAEELPQIGLAVYTDHVAGRHIVGNFKPAPLRPKTHWNLDELFLEKPQGR